MSKVYKAGEYVKFANTYGRLVMFMGRLFAPFEKIIIRLKSEFSLDKEAEDAGYWTAKGITSKRVIELADRIWEEETKSIMYDSFELRPLFVEDFPEKMESHTMYIVKDFKVGFRCPDGCGAQIQIPIIGDHPKWDLSFDAEGRPTLSPSILKTGGCKSHFWVRQGKVEWCG